MDIRTKNDFLQEHPLFAGLDESKISAAVSCMRLKKVYPGEVIHYGDLSNSRIYLLFEGKVKLAAFGRGDNELIKEIITAPDVFGHLSLNGSPLKEDYAEILSPYATIGIFNIPDFKKLLQDNHILAIAYANMATAKLSRLEHRHSDLVFCSAKTRLIHFIKGWAQADGSKIGDRIILLNFLTHSDIANVITTSRQSVTVMLNELRDEGMLLYNRKQIQLCSSVYWN